MQDNAKQSPRKLKLGHHWDLSTGQQPQAQVKIDNGKDPTQVLEHPGVAYAAP